MARFKNISGEDLRVGRADGPLVEAGEVVTLDDDAAVDDAGDAWVVGEGDDARAWPKATWELLDKPKGKTAGKGEG